MKTSARLGGALLGAMVLAAGQHSAPASEPNFARLEQQFHELPVSARRLIGPLFWLHGNDTKEHLQEYVERVAEGGNGGFTAESRPHTDWLGPGWYRDLGILLESAKARNLKLWIFDEKWWPSQSVAGRVPPRYAAKRLEAATTEVTGPRVVTAEGYGGEHYVAAVAGRASGEGKIEGDSLLDLGPFVHDSRLEWKAPAGHWKILRFSYALAPGLAQGGGKDLSVDGASRDCVDWFLRTVYQPHYDHFKDDFGKTIQGFFYDEPETAGDWGTEVDAVLAERNVDWKKAYVAYKAELAGEEQAAARYGYLDAFAEAWGRTMYGGISRWCHEHGVRSIGHMMEHGGLYRDPRFCAGDMMHLQKYTDMGGIDAVFDQFVWGKRVTRDAPVWQTPKLGSSISHAYGKENDLAMVEIFGARGQDLTYPEMKWWADHMEVCGVNFLIPHSFNPKSPYDTDCPPYFFDSGFEPRWPLFRVFADYVSRLSLMLTGGRHVAPVALLAFGQSHRVGQAIPPEQMSEALQDALYDCDWLPYEVFESDTSIEDKHLRLRKESYRVLVVPPVEVIPYETLRKARAFFEQGGVVLGYGFLPSVSATLGRSAADIGALIAAIWGRGEPSLSVCRTNAAGGRSYFLPAHPSPDQLRQALREDAAVHPTVDVLEGRTGHWLHALHRVRDGRDMFFIANQNLDGGARRFRLRFEAAGYPEWWDAMRNAVYAAPFQRVSGKAELSVTLQPNESVLLVFQPQKRALPLRPSDEVRPERSIAVSRLSSLPRAERKPDLGPASGPRLEGCEWVWFPETNSAANAPPGTRYFRRRILIPAGRSIEHAMFLGTADNGFSLFVNGREAGHGDDSSEGWRNPVALDVARWLHGGVNQLAIAAVNAGQAPNPAGLMGRLRIEFDQGEPVVLPVDETWKCSTGESAGWTEAGFDDQKWVAAKSIGLFGVAPWGSLGGRRVTVSPVTADPFDGRCEIPPDLDLSQTLVFLESDGLAPEAAARVTVNGRYAGGFLGKPLRLEVSRYLSPGANSVRVEPFAPRTVRLQFYPKPAAAN